MADAGEAKKPAKRPGRASSPTPELSKKGTEPAAEDSGKEGKEGQIFADSPSARTWPDLPGSYYHILQMGARISPLETLFCYLLPIFFVMSSYYDWFMWNGLTQLLLFIPVVEIPALWTGHMFYVDVGWPAGLVLLSLNAMYYGTGWWWRRALLGGVMCMHGSRMALGALMIFYPNTDGKLDIHPMVGWARSATQDIPRYRYAKVRFMTKDGMPEKLWPLKMLHDTLQQCYANATFLALPMMLVVFNTRESFHPLELIGVTLWALCWLWENVADGQKVNFMLKSKAAGDSSTAVLGHAPYDGQAYSLWTLCRHPNYFGEWMSWNAIVLASLPSLFASSEPAWIKAGFLLTLAMLSRFFYDCLMYWTGSEPAEHFSVQKRPSYKEYQKNTRVFFPIEVPSVDHARVEGWPNPSRVK